MPRAGKMKECSRMPRETDHVSTTCGEAHRLQCMGESSIGDTGSRQYNIDRSGNVYDPLGLPIE